MRLLRRWCGRRTGREIKAAYERGRTFHATWITYDSRQAVLRQPSLRQHDEHLAGLEKYSDEWFGVYRELLDQEAQVRKQLLSIDLPELLLDARRRPWRLIGDQWARLVTVDGSGSPTVQVRIGPTVPS